MEFYFLLNITLISRLLFGFKDEPISIKRLAFALIFQIIFFFLFKLSFLLIILIFLTVAVYFSIYIAEKRLKNINLIRFISLFIFIILFSLFTSDAINISFNPLLIKSILSIKSYFYIFSGIQNIHWIYVNVIVMGALLLLNETNIGIRLFFNFFNLEPHVEESDNQKSIDKKEYNAGRIIGILERLLIFIFVLAHQYAAIGFIIAAKGFTRFKELEDRNFAEYVLIGTFLSSISAILISLIIKNIIV